MHISTLPNSVFHLISHIYTIDIKELCARPGIMYGFWASSGNVDISNLQPLVECRSPPYIRQTVMLDFLVFTFICGDVGFRYDPISPVSSMDVLSWFTFRYSTLNHCYNLYRLLPVNVFTPTCFHLDLQSLLP